jgi:hypothetical protein
MAEMQKASGPTSCTTPAPPSMISCICEVMSAVPTGTATISKSSPAFSMIDGPSDSNRLVATGTSIVTKATLSAPLSSATEMGRPNAVV